jgi:hypothetical protein
MVNVYTARFEASDPGTPFEVPFPSTPAGWRPDTVSNTTLLGAVVRDTLATIPQTLDLNIDSASTYYPGAIGEILNAQMDLWRGASPTALALPTPGEIEVHDPTGRWDHFMRQAWRGGQILVHRGLLREGPQDLVARLSVAAVRGDRRSKRFAIRDLGYVLNTTPLHTWRYSGAGDYDGDPAVRDHVRPLGFGGLFNASPKLINAQYGIYQVTVGSLISVTGARDGGSPLTIIGDYPDFASLKAATLAVNEVATCLALGLVRVGGAPQRGFTVDATARGTYTTAGLMNALVSDFGGKGHITPLSGGAVALVDAALPGHVGLYLPQETTIAAAISRLVHHAELPAWVTLAGEFQIVAIGAPSGGSPIPRWQVLGEPTWDIVPPRRGTRGGWRRNWTIQSEADLAPIISAADKRLYGQPVQPLEMPAPNGDTEAQWVELPSLWVNETDARRQMGRSNEAWGVQRRRGTVPLALPENPKGPDDGVNMGGVRTLEGYRGAGITDITPLAVIGFAGSPQTRRRTVTLWG